MTITTPSSGEDIPVGEEITKRHNEAADDDPSTCSGEDIPAGEESTTKNNEADDEDPPDLKVILIGDSAVGKSKLVERFLLDDFNPQRLSTHALTLYRKNVKLGDGTNVKTEIWDTAGQERFNVLHSSYYWNADVCLLVFDITRKQTYVNLKKWYSELRQHCESIPCILVANKVDIDYSVTRKKYKFAGQNNLPLFYVSSSDGTNVVKVSFLSTNI
jgi:Rab-like protein 2